MDGLDAPTLVIFDFDGTLANSGPWFARELNGVARRFGFREVTRAELEEIRGQSPLLMLQHLQVARWKLPFISHHMRKLMLRDIDQIALFPGIARLLTDLDRAGVLLAIVSSNAEANIRGVLGVDLAGRIDYFVCGSSLFGKGPKIRRLLKQINVPPHCAIAIGDEIRDIDAAEMAGVASGAVGWGYGSPGALRARGPTRMFDTVEELDRALMPQLQQAV